MMAKAKLVGEMSKGHQDGLWEIRKCVNSFKTVVNISITETDSNKSCEIFST